MLENNLRLGAFVKYQDIYQDKSGQWVAWYYEDFNLEGILSKKIKGSK
jgi:hypothetical protein